MQALAGPQGSAEASFQHAEPCPADVHAHCGTLPDFGQPALEDEPSPLREAIVGAALGGAVAGGQTVPSQSVGVRQGRAVSDREAMDIMPGRANLTPVETALLPVLIRLSGGVIDTFLRRLREALGPTHLRWGCLKDFESDFVGDSGAVSPPPQHGSPSALRPLALSWGVHHTTCWHMGTLSQSHEHCAGLGARERQPEG